MEEKTTKTKKVNQVEKKVQKKINNVSKVNSEEKKDKVKKENFKNSEVIFLVIVTCIVSLIMGWTISERITSKIDIPKGDEYIEQFVDTYNKVIENYYSDVDKQKLINGAIEGMINSLGDDYSIFIGSESQSSFNARLEGEYDGIGVEVANLNGQEITILTVFENSPAYIAGLKVGDVILKIDDKDLKGESTTTLVEYIKNNNKSEYNLVVKRDGEEIEKILSKKTVKIESVGSKIYEKNNKKIGYISIDIFSKNAYTQFSKELSSLEKDNIDSLIIDVRDNTGGYLTTASNIVSLFLDSKNVIYQTEKKGKATKFYSTGKVTKKYPIVVLQNNVSASAAELLSSCLKEQYKATIIGTKSYGKGTVQELVTLSNGIEYKYTSKKWLTPTGKWINKIGVEPDIELELSEDYINDPSEENDNQLQKALTILAE